MSRLLLVSLLLAGTALAQLPMPPFSNTLVANVTRGFSFTSPVAFTITSLNVPNESAQPEQCVEVALFPGAPNGNLQTMTSLFVAQNVPAGTPIPCNIPIQVGDEVLIQGCCSNLAVTSDCSSSYGPGGGAFQTDILGFPTTIYRAGTQMTLTTTAGAQAFGGITGPVGRVEATIQTPAGYATKVIFGAGCYASLDSSFYEFFTTTPSIDLQYSSFQCLPAGSGYVVTSGGAVFHPIGAGATNLGLGDDDETTVGLSHSFAYPGGMTNSLVVCSNGYVSVASNGIDYAPHSVSMLGWSNAAWCVWHDFVPTPANNVMAEEANGVLYLTWNDVVGYNGQVPSTVPTTIQFQFDTNTGVVGYVFQNVDNTSISTWPGADGWVVGHTRGGPSNDRGNVDLSGPGLLTSTSHEVALQLAGNVRPTIPSNVTLTVGEIPAAAVLSAVVFGLTKHDPGIDMSAQGAPGCRQFASTDAVVLLFGGPTASAVLAVPNLPVFAGVHVTCQGASYVPGINALNVITSNGIDLGIDIH